MAKKPKKGPFGVQKTDSEDEAQETLDELEADEAASVEETPTDLVETPGHHPSLVERVLDKVGIHTHAHQPTAEKLEKISEQAKKSEPKAPTGAGKSVTKVPGKHRKFL